MQTTSQVKTYLLQYLTEEFNNQKVVCISGNWGIGKTYFWKNVEENITKNTKIKVIYPIPRLSI